jgi:ABC-type uncharacterized transport system permease subunit
VYIGLLHTFIIFNTGFFMVTLITWTCPNVILYVHCLSCLCLFYTCVHFTPFLSSSKFTKVKQKFAVSERNFQLVYSKKVCVLICYIITGTSWKNWLLKYPGMCLLCWCPQSDLLTAHFKPDYGNEKLLKYSLLKQKAQQQLE